MPEPQKVVHLTSAQRRRKKFKHPLLDSIPPLLTTECLDQLLSDYFETSKNDTRHIEIGQELVASYFRLLRSVVARFLYHWPVSRRFLDEMVSTGAEVITEVIATLKLEQLQEEDRFKSLGGLIESSIRYGIEDTINNLRGVAPATRRTNHSREREGRLPVYGTIETNLMGEDIRDSQVYTDFDSLVFEIRDTLKEIAKTDIEAQILMAENWSLSNAEMAEKLGVSYPWLTEIKRTLRERYNRLEEQSS
jgi:hypothetical protein